MPDLPSIGRRTISTINKTLSEPVYKNETPAYLTFTTTDGSVIYTCYSSRVDLNGLVLVERYTKTTPSGGTLWTREKTRSTWASAIAGTATGWVGIDDTSIQ